MAVGDRFVRRHDAARGSTANGTAADITYDTAVLNEGSGYTYNGPDVEVADAGLYLFMFDIGQVDLASTRAVGTLVPRLNGTTDQVRYRATHRYLRNSDAAQHGASFGACILDLAANDDVRVRNPGALAPTDAVGNYATVVNQGGGMQLIRLPANNFTEVQRTVDAAEVGATDNTGIQPWTDATGNWTKITYNSEVRDDDSLYPGTGGDITLAANKKYLIVWGATLYDTDANRCEFITRLVIDGVNVQTSSGYQRNAASQGPPHGGIYLHETGGTTETLYLDATKEYETVAGTRNVSDAYLQVFELPDTAEWIHVDNGTTDIHTTDFTNTATWYDMPVSSTFRADGDSNLSLDGANNAVQNDSGASLPVLAVAWERMERDGVSGQRKNFWTRFDNGGTALAYGISGAFNRGAQSDDGTFNSHFNAAATLDLANAADLTFQVREPSDTVNSDVMVNASTNRHFLGLQVLNLETLVGGETITLDGHGDASSDGDGDITVRHPLGNAHGDSSSQGTGTLGVTTALDGHGDSASEGDASLTVWVYIAGAGSSASEAAGVLSVGTELRGNGDAASEGTGSLFLELAIGGAGNAASEGDADLTVITTGFTGWGIPMGVA